MHRVEPLRESFPGHEHLVVGRRQRREALEHGAHHPIQSARVRMDPPEVPARDVGKRQESQRLRRRSTVDHHDVIATGRVQRFQLGQRDQLLEAGQHRQLLRLDTADAHPLEHPRSASPAPRPNPTGIVRAHRAAEHRSSRPPGGARTRARGRMHRRANARDRPTSPPPSDLHPRGAAPWPRMSSSCRLRPCR